MHAASIRNAMTVDVEDYFQVSAFAPHISRSDWDHLPCRVERNVEEILQLLDNHGAHATFFTLGWIAERYPALIKRIVDGGHELASHGYGHWRATEQTQDAFRDDVRMAKTILEDLSGNEVRGYRAPSFSIGRDSLWGHEVLAEVGYKYSSSVYPIQHDHYGLPEAPRFVYHPEAVPSLVELPITTVVINGQNYPAGGGGYFRLLPYWMSRWGIREVNRRDRRPCIFYFHPWEIDPEQPIQKNIGLKTKFRHYVNLGRMKRKLDALMSDFRWDRIDCVFPEVAA